MHYVYILRSETSQDKIYSGRTKDLKSRLRSHNYGQSKFTANYRPWRIVWYASFESKKKAIDFERYLKTASGIAFLRKRLI